MTPTISVAHVEDELMLLTTFRFWLEEAAPDLSVVASVTGVERLIAELADPPDVVVLDPVLGDGTTLQDNIRRLHGWGAAVVVTTSDTSTPALRIVAFQENVAAFLDKRADPAELVTAIRAAADGRRHVTDEWTRFLSRTPVRITARQREALRFYGVGMTYAEGGRRMGIRESSFKEHIDAVRARYREAGHRVDTRAELSGEARLDGHLTEW